MRLVLLAAALLAASPPTATATADDATIAAASQAIADALVPISFARGLLAVCARRDPAGSADRTSAHDAWRRANGVDGFEAAMAAVQAKSPQLAASRDRLESASAAEAAKAVAKDPATCRQMASMLAGPRFQIGGVTAQAERVLLSLAQSRSQRMLHDRPRSEQDDARTALAQAATIATDPAFAPQAPFGYVRRRSGSTRSSAG